MTRVLVALAALAIFLLAPAQSPAQPAADQAFELTIDNLTPYDLSPGGYVIHGPQFELFSPGSPAPPAVRSLCETGSTADFLFYVRKETGKIRNAFALIGGVPALKTVRATIHSSENYPYLSLLHKISFTDDNCSGAQKLNIFSPQETASRTTLRAYDAGTKQNLHETPYRNPFLARLSPAYWTSKATVPLEPFAPSPLFRDMPIARLTVRPIQRGEKFEQEGLLMVVK